jgi:hypothetical protein
MTETLLWSIIISGIWRSIMTPTYSTMNKWSCEPLLHDQFLLSRDILHVRDPFIWYQPYLVQSRYRQVLFYSFCDITFSWTIHVLASYVNVISPRGPRVYLSVIRMDKSHSWSTSLNWHFLSTQWHLYNHPVTVWRLVESKHSSDVSDWRDLMV